MKQSIDDILFDYFYTHPEKNVDDVIKVAQTAYASATKQIVPAYKARLIDDLDGIPDDYDTKYSQVKRKEYHDESTFEGEYE